MSRKHEEPGTFALLAKLPQQFVALAKAELSNAKREMAQKAKRGGIGIAAFVIALFFLFWAIACFAAAAIAGIAVVWPVWLSALVVGVGLVLLAVAAVMGGIAFMKRGVPIPEETIDRVEGDLAAFSEVRVNASAHRDDRTPRTEQTGDPR